MRLAFRAVLNAPSINIVACETAIDTWMRAELDAPLEKGSKTLGNRHVSYVRSIDGSLEASRFILETNGIDFTDRLTIIAATAPHDENWLWIDQESTSRPSRADTVTTVPGIVPIALKSCGLSSMIEPLSVTDTRSSQKLIESFYSGAGPQRLVLAVRGALADDRSPEHLLRTLTGYMVGMAIVVDASGAAADYLTQELEPPKPFVPGSVTLATRTSEGVRFSGVIPGSVVIRQQVPVARRLRVAAVEDAERCQLPELLGQRVLMLPGFPRNPSLDESILLDELVDREESLSELRNRNTQLEEQYELAVLEQDEALSDLDSAESRIRFLEKRLTEAGANAIGDFYDPEDDLDIQPSGCIEAVEFGRELLPWIEIGPTDNEAIQLDAYTKSCVWAKKAWKAFRALNDYAVSRSSQQFRGNFFNYCSDPPSGGIVVPKSWVALNESESTDKNPALQQARTFSLYHLSGEGQAIYMPAHIKVQMHGSASPRIHFFDDTDGPSGKVLIGYFGKHLPISGS